MRLEIDLNACVGHGRCYAEAPHAIDADDEGRGVVLDSEVPEQWHDEARLAAISCPEQAVRLDEQR
jgi:ferredoxin